MSESSYLRDCSYQVSQIFFISLFDRFTAYYNSMSWNFRKLVSLQLQCTSIVNRDLNFFDRSTAYYYNLTWNISKLKSPRFQCTSVTSRLLSLVDRFTAYYNCMT